MNAGKRDMAGGDLLLTIEVPEPPRTTTCAKCGEASTHTTGFVYRGGDAYAIYHAGLHRHDDGPRVDLAIGIGTWPGPDSVAETSAFLAVWLAPRDVRFGFVDPSESVWASARLLHNQLSAEAARTGTIRTAMLAVAELVVSDDPSVARHLA